VCNPSNLARRLADLRDDKERAVAMGRRARALAERRFARHDLAKQLETVLVSAGGARPGAPGARPGESRG